MSPSTAPLMGSSRSSSLARFRGVGIAVALTASRPDLDAIIEAQDCDAAMALTDADVAGVTAKQQIGLSTLVAGCALEEPLRDLMDALQ